SGLGNARVAEEATRLGAGLLAVGTAGLLLTTVRYRPETAQLLACGSAAVLLLPYAWLVLGRPGAHR
ncbi:hypothetical protein, partial [Kitasatospora nipponensis]|uniref:hypothetical protein n=1 Tax=Kitasatospora nipponensis TaxID=258049 RepID=UPI0031E243B7